MLVCSNVDSWVKRSSARISSSARFRPVQSARWPGEKRRCSARKRIRRGSSHDSVLTARDAAGWVCGSAMLVKQSNTRSSSHHPGISSSLARFRAIRKSKSDQAQLLVEVR
jgi:hypothetical protein